jgi:hypothetical protein
VTPRPIHVARRALKRQGYRLWRSRWRRGSIDNFGDFAIVLDEYDCIVAGPRFDLTLDDVEQWLAE